MANPRTAPTASMVVIGDEVLSGRTKDRNAGELAERLDRIGIVMREIRFVPDEEPLIIEAVTLLRGRYDHVFTSGGIGPTHDDITAQAIANAFGLPLVEDPRAIAILTAFYKERDLPFTAARRRMTRMPEGSGLIANPVSAAPGFTVGNVHVMAGVPSVFNAMCDEVLASLKGAVPLVSASVYTGIGEGTFGDALSSIALKHEDISIGSYPRHENGSFSVEIIIRGQGEESVRNAREEIEIMLKDLHDSATEARTGSV